MSVMGTIERLVSFGPRWAGDDGDRPTVDYLANALRAAGRDAEVERIRVRPAYQIALALLATVAVVGSVVSVSTPALGVAILLIACIAIYFDLTGRPSPVRFLTSPRDTANVSSPGDLPDASNRVVLTAHHDAAHGGLLFARRQRRPRPSPFSRLAGRVDLVFWAAIAGLAAAVVRLVSGWDSNAMSAVQFVPTVVLIVLAVLLLDSALARVVPGASDNASGVAAVLEVAQRLSRQPTENIDVWVVFTGAKEGFMLGMRAWLKKHAEDLSSDRTWFVNVDTVGNGEPHHVTAEGFALLYRHDRRLIAACEQLGSRPHVWRLGTDGVVPLMRGYPSITLCSLEHGRIPNFHRPSDTVENVDPRAVETAADLVEGLVRRIDGAFAQESAARMPSRA
jgi:peptidase M28-like protein